MDFGKEWNRRALLKTAGGAAAGWIVAVAARPWPARAEEPDRGEGYGPEGPFPDKGPKGVIGVSLFIAAKKVGEPAELIVAGVAPGSPAERAGVDRGDRILAVNGKTVQGMTYQEVSGLIRGEPGTTLRLRVKGDAGERDLELKRVSIDDLRRRGHPTRG